jgi:DNA repair protein RecN (Recombination protein N)
MLRRLDIERYGLIAKAEIEFAQGATLFTGETGSGKTMLLGALDFALGARAGADAVARGAAKAVVTLTFDPDDALRERLSADGFELDPGEEGAIVREMTDAGRSTLRVNGRPATAAYVRAIADAVADVVGQHEAQRLLAPSYHLVLLDRFAGPEALRLRAAVGEAYRRSSELQAQVERLHRDDGEARRRYDDACFALREIEEAHLEAGETERLDERRRYLDNAERIAAALRAANVALSADDGGAVGALGDAGAALAGVSELGGTLREMRDRCAALQSEANDLAAAVARALEETEFDPAELETINARLDLIDRLKRKYAVSEGDVAGALLTQADAQRAIVHEYEGRDRRGAELAAASGAAQRELASVAAQLGALRRKAAAALAARVVSEFGEIALGSGRFDVALTPLDAIAADGAERAEFLFAANAGEPARPLSRVASGGELSRVLLALIVVLADVREGQGALVFDEIDAGIGGATATAVGARIGKLALRGQVVCVTHLAQLATWADRHYVLEKAERGDQTTIGVREAVTQRERESELARMLSGETHDAALRHARALLRARSP